MTPAILLGLACLGVDPQQPLHRPHVCPLPPGQVQQLPNDEAAKHGRRIARLCVQYLECRQVWDLRPQVWDALQEARRLYLAWDLLDDVTGYHAGRYTFSRETVEGRLDRLRGLLGFADFYAGRMPAPIPTWCFPPQD